MKARAFCVSFILFASLMISITATATDWYVDAVNGSDNNGGTSLEDAWKTLKHATSQTNYTGTEEEPCIMHVAPGIYSPSANGETFPLAFFHAGIPEGYGELRGSGSDVTIIDAEGTSRVLQLTLDNGTVSDVTITGGDHAGGTMGGGISAYCAGGTIHLERCVVRDNYKGRGLDTAVHPGTYIITDCQFINNNGPRDGSGAGIRINNMVTMKMANCLVANNTIYDDPRFVGGRLYIEADTYDRLIN